MASQTNIFTKIQYGPESSAYGTETVSYNELSRVQSAELTQNNNFIQSRGLGEGINLIKTPYGIFTASGSISFNPVDFDFLKHWVGAKSGAGSSGDPYLLTEATTAGPTSNLVPFSLEMKNDTETTNSVWFAIGCMGTSFNLTGSLGSKLLCTANFVAQKTKLRTTGQTYTPVTTTEFIMLGSTIKWGATPTAISGIQSFEIGYNNNLISEETRSIESRFINQPLLGQREYNFTISILMANALASTIIANFYGKTSAGPVYEPEDGSTSTEPTDSLEFEIELVNGSKYGNLQIDECVIERISVPASVGGGLVILTVEGIARKGLGNVPIKWWDV